jgi:hypothetical protein
MQADQRHGEVICDSKIELNVELKSGISKTRREINSKWIYVESAVRKINFFAMTMKPLCKRHTPRPNDHLRWDLDTPFSNYTLAVRLSIPRSIYLSICLFSVFFLISFMVSSSSFPFNRGYVAASYPII